mmetsp:Transcript_29825/g.96219  ORF Transcript_29825/g.96219 Transcript_29825/m.96219 type:complete len:339 (-) Transcript_29825:403-1419(-)
MGGGTSRYDAPEALASVWFGEFEAALPRLEGKVVAITGCTTGTGFVAAKTCAAKGAKVLMLNRPSERAEKAVKEVAGGVHVDCDLMDFGSVKAAVAKVKTLTDSLDVLCNNAGVMALVDKATVDGYDVQMQTNHLSHFLLTKELYPLLEKAAQVRGEARIVNHSSGARNLPPGKLDGKYLGKNGGNLGGDGNSMFFGGARWQRYHQTKLANAVFTVALAEKIPKEANIKALVAAPGLAATNLQVTTNQDGGFEASWIMKYGQSAEDGTMPLLHCMVGAGVDNGQLWEPGGGLFHMKGKPATHPLEALSTNPDSRKLLWDLSEKACGGEWPLGSGGQTD